MDEPREVFASLSSLGIEKGGVYGVFSNQGYVDDATMIRQGARVACPSWPLSSHAHPSTAGNAIAEASLDFGVKHLVYSSVDVGGLDDTGIAA